MSIANASQHLQRLKRAGLVIGERQGTTIRYRLADPSMILWIAMIAILVFLIASPMVRLVVSSFQDPESGRLTWENYLEA